MVQFITSYCSLGLFLSLLQPGAMRCHGTRGCKRCPSTSLYELLSLNFNSLFSSLLLSWSVLDIYMCIVVLCTSCCVVFLYNVPPLMGQVLGKVLLTSWEIS